MTFGAGLALTVLFLGLLGTVIAASRGLLFSAQASKALSSAVAFLLAAVMLIVILSNLEIRLVFASP